MRTRLSVLTLLVAIVLAAGPLAACGPADETAQPGDSTSDSTSGGVVPGPSGSSDGRFRPPPDPSAPKDGAGAAGETTIIGVPEEGVEAGCLVLRSGDRLYLLLGGDRRLLTSGRPVVVRGRPNPAMMTTCQQGVPFQVAEVKPA